MIAMVLASIGLAHGQSCADVNLIPESAQVAWVSPVAKSVGMNSWIETVRVADLRAWIRENGSDQVRVLKGLGMVRTKGGKWAAKRSYKITIFDVKREWLCRPIEGATPGTLDQGVSVCEEKQHKGLWGHKRGYTGCGYIEDTLSRSRSLDAYRVRWGEASRWGFCVLPLERFLEGA